MAAVTTTTGAKLIPEKWSDIDINTNEEMVFADKIIDKGTVNGKLHIPLMASIAANTLSAGSGSNLTFTANTETEATFSPATRYAAVEIEKPVQARAPMMDIQGSYKKNLEFTLAAIIDQDCLQDVASLSQIVSAPSGLDLATTLDASGKVVQSAKRLFKAGQSTGVCIVPASQYDEIMSILNYTSAQVRGDDTNPLVGGWIVKAGGFKYFETGNCYVTGGNAYGVAMITGDNELKSGPFAIGYNQRVQPLVQEYQLTDRVILWSDFAHNILRDAYGVALIVPA
jgi:hypothetical protein